MKKIQNYILFSNHDSGMRLYKQLKKVGVKAVIAPTPRQASKCCGISLMIETEDTMTAEECAVKCEIEILDIVTIERDMNPNRDRYC